MNIFIVKSGHILAWTEDEGLAQEYSLMTCEAVPEYPQDGKTYELDLVDGVPSWVEVHATPTLQAQIDALNDRIDRQEYAWKPGDSVKVGDRRYYNGKWYVCIQAHTTQSDWTPDVVPALWSEE